ncbi:GGDEF domain-containing protein [Paenibacillus sp. TRM 82003]|nr:GGDEF domain-containing protein [Paenibacillus sp. TRM 82003]
MNQGKRRTIGLLVDDVAGWGFGDYFQSNVVAGVAEAARARDANLLCYAAGNLDSPNDWVRGRNILFEFIDANKVDGLIVLTTAIGLRVPTARVLEKLSQYENIPIVTVGDALAPHYSVTIDNYRSMREAVEHMIVRHGRSSIAFIQGSPGSLEAEYRYRAYRDALAAHEIAYDERRVFQGNFLFEAGARAVHALKERNVSFDGIVAANDNMAIGAMTELLASDGKLPEHLSVIGFDDIEPSEMLSLTTVKQSFFDQAVIAADTLLRILDGESVPKTQQTEARLIVRSSCGCIPHIVAENIIRDDAPSAPLTEQSAERIAEAFLHRIDREAQAAGGMQDPEAYRMLRGELERLPEPLIREILFRTENTFFFAWRSVIFHAIQRKIDLNLLHSALTCLRSLILPTVKGNEQLAAAAENLFQMARIQISEAVQRTGVSVTYMSSLLSDQLEQLGEELVTHLELSELMDVVYRKFPKHGIHEAYICLYEDSKRPMNESRLLLAYRNGERLDLGESGIRFPTTEFLPVKVRIRLQAYRQQFLVQTLHHGSHAIGYVVFSFERSVNKAYELLRHRLSNAIRVSKLIDDVRRHSLSLEQQVADRTKELSELNEELHALSIRDELTGLLNRRGFLQRGEAALGKAAAARSRLLLVYADLDNLKRINDRHGHAEGDRAIRMAAKALRLSFDPADIVSRLAGDEFTAIVVGEPDRDEPPEGIRRRVQNHADRISAESGCPFELSFSMGFAVYDPERPCGFEELMRLADQALYQEKRRKKDNVEPS